MFELLPENTYSRKAVRWGVVVSLLFIATGVFGILRHHYEDGFVNIVLGVVMLFIWGTRRREPLQIDVSESKATK
jgi:uncharacterized membrane protein